MGSKLFVLLWTQFRNQSALNALRYERDAKKKGRMYAVFGAYAIVFIMVLIYSFGLAFGYGFLGMADVIPGFSLMICSMVILFFTITKSNGFLFACRDYDMVMALPFSTGTVITARFLYMYLTNLLMSVCVMVPMCLGYAFYERPGLIIYLLWFVMMLFAPMIPMAIACAIGAVIAAIGSKFRFKVLVQLLLFLALMLGIFAGSFAIQGAENDAVLYQKASELGVILQEKMHQIYPLSVLFDAAITNVQNQSMWGSIQNSHVLSAGCFILVSFICYMIFVLILSWKYKAINTALMTSQSRSNYQMKEQASHSVMQAFVYKEWKRFLSSVIYLMNTGIGMILAVMGSVMCLALGVEEALASMDINLYGQSAEVLKGILYGIPFAIAIPLTMTCTTAVSWSLEGKNLWILKSLPLSEKMIFEGKMLFNVILLVPAGIICTVCMILAMKPDIITGFLYFVVVFAAILFSTAFGMWINKTFPNFGWTNEVEVVKQGISSMLGIFANMLVELLLAVFTVLLSGFLDGRIVMLLFAALLLGGGYFFYWEVTKTI